MPDKYAATWVSHSSISDFVKCPRCYYLKNVYRDPKTNHKIQLMSPPLALGSAVHEVLESLSVLPTDKRQFSALMEQFHTVWKRVEGKQGGFHDAATQDKYLQRGEAMIRRVQAHPGPLTNLAVKIKEDLPHYWISEADNIILCGKLDWLEYMPDTDQVHIIDFKTSKQEEDGNSLQLPIYYLLATNTQKRNVAAASYWYLEWSDELTPKELPDLQEAHAKVLAIAQQIKTARALERYACKQGGDGCFACRPYEQILAGEAEYIGVGTYGNDMYILSPQPAAAEDADDSVIL